jgi:hypothetical protein
MVDKRKIFPYSCVTQIGVQHAKTVFNEQVLFKIVMVLKFGMLPFAAVLLSEEPFIR